MSKHEEYVRMDLLDLLDKVYCTIYDYDWDHEEDSEVTHEVERKYARELRDLLNALVRRF